MPNLNSRQLGLFSFNPLAGLYISPNAAEALTKSVFTSLVPLICLNTFPQIQMCSIYKDAVDTFQSIVMEHTIPPTPLPQLSFCTKRLCKFSGLLFWRYAFPFKNSYPITESDPCMKSSSVSILQST